MTGGAAPVYRSRTQAGYSPDIQTDHRSVRARKRINTIQAHFAAVDGTITTPEGVVHVRSGDAIMTGAGGHQWRVSQESFAHRYRPVPPTRMGEPGRYESLPTEVIAIAMDTPFEVVLRDGISQLHGERGDWLVDYGDGSLGIVAAEVFGSLYEIVG
jgi:hypothetical protein